MGFDCISFLSLPFFSLSITMASEISIYRSFLADRNQQVVLDGKTSSAAFVTSGVPQATVLVGSLMFLIGVGRFRILGDQGLGYFEGVRGANSQQAHDVVLTSILRNDVASTSFRRHVATRFLINQCQIITFLILKFDNIENSGIELKGIVLPVPSNQIKVACIIILPFNLVHL